MSRAIPSDWLPRYRVLRADGPPVRYYVQRDIGAGWADYPLRHPVYYARKAAADEAATDARDVDVGQLRRMGIGVVDATK